MDIAVIIGEVGFISHKDVIDGILDKAFKADVNVFLFTCEGWRYSENVSYAKGEYNIFNLPNMKNYAGVIVDFGTIYDDEAKEVILQKLGGEQYSSSIHQYSDAFITLCGCGA